MLQSSLPSTSVKPALVSILGSQGFKNSLYTLLTTVVYPAAMIVFTPYFIHQLGDMEYGLWVLINTVTQLMSVFNMGLGDANIRFISSARANQQISVVSTTASTTFSLALVILLFSIAIGVVLSYLCQSRLLFAFESTIQTLAVSSFIPGLTLFGLKLIEVVILAIFQGFNRYDQSSLLGLGSRMIILISNVILVYLGFHLATLLLFSCLVQIASIIVQVYLLQRFHHVKLALSFQGDSVRKIFSFSLWTWLQSVFAIVTTQVDKLVVATFYTVSGLAYYSLGSTVTTQIHGIFSSASGWVFPTVTKQVALNRPLLRSYYTAEVLMLGMGYGVISLLLLFQDQIFTAWLGTETYENAKIYIKLFLYYNLFLLCNILPFYYLNGSGHVRYNTLSELVTKVLNLGSLMAGFTLLGVRGLILGLISSMIPATLFKLFLLRKALFPRINTMFYAHGLLPAILIVASFEAQSFVLASTSSILAILCYYYLVVRPSRLLSGGGIKPRHHRNNVSFH
jgi:O-antigen/teichoic acid export membrane protein